jgi:hypothetical protein
MTKLDAFVAGLGAGATPVWSYHRRQLLWRAYRVLSGTAEERVQWGRGYHVLRDREDHFTGWLHFIGLSAFWVAAWCYAFELFVYEEQHLAGFVVACLPAAAFFWLGFWRLAAMAAWKAER